MNEVETLVDALKAVQKFFNNPDERFDPVTHAFECNWVQAWNPRNKSCDCGLFKAQIKVKRALARYK